ncbi:CE1759 family FMN reductase [Aeromicrobium sp. UC242_57]|uniref:CE1759 family FMN reductase n=1 Tax=Aeromicrobium sp. UC242_57 TaxID=3374624 RepID=UPI0037A44B43
MLTDRFVASLQEQSGDVSVEVVSLRELAHDITDAMLTGFAAPRLQDVIDKVVAADGLVVVTPIFKASFPGLFKSFIDVLDADALIGKPVLLAATGGTARHSLAIDHSLRPLFAYLQALVVPTGVFASSHDWGTEGANALNARIDRASGERSACSRAPARDARRTTTSTCSASRSWQRPTPAAEPVATDRALLSCGVQGRQRWLVCQMSEPGARYSMRSVARLSLIDQSSE